MKSPFCIAPLLFLQLVDPSWAIPWDPPTCPLPAQRFLPSKIDDGDGATGKYGFVPTKMLDLLLPRQTSGCSTTTCNSQYYCCNSETCSYDGSKWKCLAPTSTTTTTTTWRSTTTSISTTTLTITSTTSDTVTFWTEISEGTWTTTTTVTSTTTSYTTSTAPLTKRGMPTPTRCVQRSPEEERRRGLARRQDQTIYVTVTTTVTQTPASTYYKTTTWLWTEWITSYSTWTRLSYSGAVTTVTETSVSVATTIITAIVTPPPPPSGLTPAEKAGISVGSIGGLAIIALVAFLIWKKRSKPTAEEQWAGNQPVEDGSHSVPPGKMGPGGAIIGAGGMIPVTGADGKTYQEQYKGYYAETGDTTMPQISTSPPPPPTAYYQTHGQPTQYPTQYPNRYPEPNPNLINTVPRRPIPGSPEPPSYHGSAGATGGTAGVSGSWGGGGT